MDRFQIEVKRVTQDEKLNDRPNAEVIIRGLHEFFSNLTGCTNHDLLSVYLRDSNGKIVGGLLSYFMGQWFHISHIWIEESLRGQGFGTRLMNHAEDKAREIGCKYLAIDTQNPLAKQFYEKLGYQVFGVLENNPREGFSRYFLSKKF
jgi:ribosomal protein S18 acetylase RimI-like enzyme